ncbi:hypothetical protein FMUND_5954 [Fusarium mundagurra]|uniref:Uncharacterized protein n=1 Tax=Fusarium mundagurra TaxID=1567541 RepID=A0A8H5YT18_9HYPO|nr:hypothetical protein FMUND_5954 [Fusarium mundagurra]
MPLTPPLSERQLQSTLTSKACNSCKARKIRFFGWCMTRVWNEVMRLIVQVTLRRVTVVPSEAYPDLKQDVAVHPVPNDLFIDRILFGSSSTDVPNADERFSLKGIGLLNGTHSVTFFSDNRLKMLSAKVQNSKYTMNRSTSLPSPRQGDFRLNRRKPWPQHNPPERQRFLSVLALGSLHDGGGSFEPGKGKAWKLLSIALAKLPDLPKAKNSLVALQAITTVAVYCLGAIIDANIIVPMPYILESHLGALNLTRILAQQSRLLLRVMNTLFCPSVCHRGSQYFPMTIEQLLEDLEQWRASIAEEFRPDYPSQFNLLRRPVHGTVGIWINYLYYSLKLILLRSRLQIDSS